MWVRFFVIINLCCICLFDFGNLFIVFIKRVLELFGFFIKKN